MRKTELQSRSDEMYFKKNLLDIKFVHGSNVLYVPIKISHLGEDPQSNGALRSVEVQNCNCMSLASLNCEYRAVAICLNSSSSPMFNSHTH